MPEITTYSSEQRKILLLSIVMMVLVTALVMIITTWTLYQSRLEDNINKLQAIVKTQAELIKAVGRFDALYSADDFTEGARAATISQLVDSLSQYDGFGQSGEIVVGQLKGEQIELLIDTGATDNKLLPPDTDNATPMRRALGGESGWLVGLDYRGEEVLAAYEAVPELQIGLVAKYDLDEVRRPFIQAASFAAMAALLIIIIGCFLMMRLANPIVAQLRRYQDELQYEEATTRAIIDSSLDGIVTINEAGKVLSVNKAAEEIFGYAGDEMLGENISLMAAGRDRAEHDNYIENYLKTGTKKLIGNRRKVTGMRKNDEPFPMELSVSEVITDRERLFTASIRDITEQQTALDKLAANERNFRTMVDTIPGTVYQCLLDEHYTMKYISDEIEKLSGYPPSDFIDNKHRTFGSLIHPDDEQHVATTIAEATDRREPYTVEYRIIDKNGKIHWVYERGAAVLDEAGELEHLDGTMMDITGIKQVEQRITSQKQYYEQLIQNYNSATFVIDAEHKVVIWNKACEKLTGIKASQVLGTRDAWRGFYKSERPCLADLVLDENLGNISELYESSTAHPFVEGGKRTMNWCPMPTGETLYFDFDACPIRDENGYITGVIEVVKDLTVRKKAEMALNDAKEDAEAATRAKSDFLANMSHEIRTPMNGIMGMVELAMDTDLTQEQREYLQTIDSSAESLLTLIDDILDFSKIEAEKLELDPIDFDLRERLGETLSTLAVRAHKKGLELAYDVDPDVPEMVVGDVHRLRQIVVNLVGNALKFTDKGEVVVRVQKHTVNDDNAELHFSVTDTGIGIPKDRLDNIFQAFEQADTSTTRKYGGTGLGLAICSRLSELMGGRIWVESTEGWGTTFHFTVKMGISKQVKETSIRVVPNELKRLHILVVDDNKTNRIILEKMLKNWQMETVQAESAIKALEKLDEGQRFDLIISDLHMPDMDGFDFIEEVRNKSSFSHIPVIFLTSSQLSGDRARANELGVKEHLIKPVRQSNMFNAIASTIGVKYGDSADASQAKSEQVHGQGLKILLAEDNEVNQKFATHALGKAGHNATVANNGREVLEHLQKDQFDLILMDLQMPEMDGFTATAAIRTSDDEAYKNIPIIALTAHAMKGDKEKCLDAGMDGYVTKPVKSKLLMAEINRVMEATS